LSALAPGAQKNQLPTAKPMARREGAIVHLEHAFSQATLQVAFYAKIFGLIQTLLFSEVNEINHLRTVAR
jgi:hypothetical protein